MGWRWRRHVGWLHHVRWLHYLSLEIGFFWLADTKDYCSTIGNIISREVTIFLGLWKQRASHILLDLKDPKHLSLLFFSDIVGHLSSKVCAWECRVGFCGKNCIRTYPYSISRFFGFAISKNNKYRKLVADMFLIRRLKSLTIGFNHATRRPNMNVNTFVFFFVQLLPSSAHRGFCFSVVGYFRGHRHGRSRLDSPVPGRVLQALSYNLDHLPLTTSRWVEEGKLSMGSSPNTYICRLKNEDFATNTKTRIRTYVRT